MPRTDGSATLFPLERVTKSQLQRLGQILWSWSLCGACDNGDKCTTESCPSQRSRRLARFFDHYRNLTAGYESEHGHGKPMALGAHEDLFEIVRKLKEHSEIPREQFADLVFGNHAGGTSPPAADQERAINLAVKIMTMVNCSAQLQSSSLLEHGAYQVPWRSDVAFSQFIFDVFPMTDHPSLNDDDLKSSMDIKPSLMAKKLKKRLRLRFRPTDDLRRHLRLDRKNNILEIYHHTAFLKEHLRLTKDNSHNMTVAESLRLGALPRQLALECLDSIQKILFPLSDSKSRSLLQSLISTSSFDPDCLRFDFVSIRNNDEKEVAYHYFGANLTDLYEESMNPTPRGWVEKWLERRSGARYVMMATLIGVVFAVVLGMAGLAVGAYQAWVSYQQWQHPVV